LPYSGEELAELLQANKWMETGHPAIVRMTREAVGDETDALEAARRIEQYVRRTIQYKDYSLGMATAAETADQKTGDCSEHAVLVAALARAAGMPSRVVAGLVYVDSLAPSAPHGFGYHMWAEVFVGEWLPLDAAVGGHDATHLVVTRNDLNGMSNLLDLVADVSRLFGRMKITVRAAE
jgi:transglutaminase-like putative cysteine protease